jgi:regulator of nonsense transcripts 1
MPPPPPTSRPSQPVKEDLVVLLARDVDVTNTEYDWDLSKWAPLVQEKEFVPWLVKRPSEAEALRARPLNVGMINRLEELWRTSPQATCVKKRFRAPR